MWSLWFAHSDDELIARLWEAGTLGLLEQADGVRAYFEDAINPKSLAGLGGEFRAESQEPVATIADWEPIAVGERWLIVPPSFREPAPETRRLLRLETGAAFGTGRHETTQLCLEALEKYVKPGASVLDVGCGSGILSQAARVLGAGYVFSCDIDLDSLELTRRNAGTPVFLGSADAVASESIDIVVANLTPVILDILAWDLARVAKREEVLVIGGFLRDSVPASFAPEQELENAGWLCWVCRPHDVKAAAPVSEGLTHKREWWT